MYRYIPASSAPFNEANGNLLSGLATRNLWKKNKVQYVHLGVKTFQAFKENSIINEFCLFYFNDNEQ